MNLDKIAISGGGTGGHFFPALAFLEFCHEKGIYTIYIGNKEGIEGKFSHLIEGEKIFMNMKGFVGKKPREKIVSLLLLVKNILELRKYMNYKIPSIIFGGYTGLPLGLYSIINKNPLFIHEQNSIPGKTNLYLSKFSRYVFYTFEHSKKFFKNFPYKRTGIPLRKSIKEGSKITKKQALDFLSLDSKPTISFIGGSQGALFINNIALELCSKLEDYQIILVTGRDKFKDVKLVAKERCPNMKVLSFTEDIVYVYKASDLVICRAGAGTISELSFLGIPAVFIPYPYASKDHQYYNAKEIEELGGGKVIRQSDASVSTVLKEIENILSDRETYSKKIKLFQPKNPEDLILKTIIEAI